MAEGSEEKVDRVKANELSELKLADEYGAPDVYIDGEDKWNTVILSPEPPAQPAKATGSFWDRLRGL